ncbi:Lrp/AsnC family transcriptional regulator [Propionibacterium australiense]|nr:Lrp/AsnC family transcriptional regulator [Propionibacterium australiense]RLP10119.1 AsnC family transcriptional regulator [Propionibacterium australiense]RLP11406.1 AsnC family transcriptional regulator [Propionibacterium australiense]
MDETDLRIVNLLQIDPRMPWARVGQILGISAATASHRWARLTSEGLAWITTLPNMDQQLTAIVEVDCTTKHLPTTIDELCRHPMILSVDETTGERDILLTISAPDMPTLTTLIIDWIGSLPGVHGTRTSLTTNVIVGTEAWRVHAIDQNEANAAAEQLPRKKPVGQAPNPELDMALAKALAADGRRSVASLSQEFDSPTTTVHRRLQRLRSCRQVIMRCDVAPELAGWFLECTWLTTVAFSHKPRIMELLRDRRVLRSCMWLTGANNLRLNLRVASHNAIADVESSIAAAIPGLAPAETIVHMRSHKSMGWLLTGQGRSTGTLVPPFFKI